MKKGENSKKPKYEAPKIISLEKMPVTEGQASCHVGNGARANCKLGVLAQGSCSTGETAQPGGCSVGSQVVTSDCGYGYGGGSACNAGFSPRTQCNAGSGFF